MAITTQMRTDVSGLYVALFGRAPDSEGLGYWVQQLDQGQTLAQVADAMYGVAPARAYYPAYLTNQEIIGNFYVNVLGRTADAEGLAYWTGKLGEPGATPGSVIAEMINVVSNYTGTDPAGIKSAALFANKVEVAQWYGEHVGTIDGATAILSGVTEDPATVDAAINGSGTPSNGTSTLAVGIDNVVGGAGNDTINAPVVQNQLGQIFNTLETGDKVDGGAGHDTLNVDLTTQQGVSILAPATSATISNVETINYRAQYISGDLAQALVSTIKGGGAIIIPGLGGGSGPQLPSNVDAELHTGVQEYWDTNSRSFVQIEDVRQAPESLTIGMRSTDPGLVASYFVLFDPAQFSQGTVASNSSLTLTLKDTAHPTSVQAFNISKVDFKLGGVSYSVGNDAMGVADTYGDFVTAFKAALSAVDALKNIQVTLNPDNTITMTDPAGGAFEAVGYEWVGNIVPPAGTLSWDMAPGAPVINKTAITTHVVLDDVGRTSEGGMLQIGSMAQGGVQVFNVDVDHSSWVYGMGSNEDFGFGTRHLETVNFNSIGAKGNVSVGTSMGLPDGRVTNGVGLLGGSAGLIDVRTVNGADFAGNLNVAITLTDDAIGRYLDPASGTVNFNYTAGAGNDIFNVIMDGAVTADPDFASKINMGAGDDRLILTVTDTEACNHISVDGGTGSNTFVTGSSHGTAPANTFQSFANFQTYEVEGTSATEHDFTSMAGVQTVVVATGEPSNGGWDTTLQNLAANASVIVSGKNQTVGNASNGDQSFGTISILGADATPTDTTLRVTLQNTARLDGTLTVNQLAIGDLVGDVNPIRTLELVSAGQRNTENVVADISAALVNTFNLSGTQDLTATITAAANSTDVAADRASLVVNGAELTGDLDLTLAGALVTAVDSGTTSTVTLTGTAGENDILRLTGAITTTNDTTIAGFETVQFTTDASGTFDGSNVTGVTLYDINDMTAAGTGTLSLIDMQGNARINVNIDDDATVAGNALVFDAAAQATTNTLDLEFRDADADDAETTNVAFGSSVGDTISARDYRTISLDLGGYADQNEAYTFQLLMQDAEGDDEGDAVALSATADAINAYDAASAYARTVTVVGGGDQGDAGSAGGVDSVDLGNLTNVISNVDVSGYTGRVTLDVVAYEDTVVDRNVTITLNGYGATLSESVVDGPDAGVTVEDGTIVTYAFTTDAVAASEDVVITGFNGFNGYVDANFDGNFDAGEVDTGIDLTNLSVLDLSALGVNGLADLTLTVLDLDDGGTAFDGVRITSNEGLNFQIDLIGVNLDMLSNENFKFAA